MQDTPDFSNSVDAMETEQGQAIATVSTPDFSNSIDAASEPTPIKPQRISAISEVARWFFGKSQLGQLETSIYLQDKLPDVDPGEDISSYQKKVEAVLVPREKKIVEGGIGKVLEKEMQLGIAAGAVGSPIRTAIALGGYSGLDKFINLRRFVDKNLPNTTPELKDIIEIADFGLKAFLVGGTMVKGEGFVKERMDTLGQPRNVNITPTDLTKIKDSGNLLPEEKTSIMQTLGVEQKHIDASLNSGLPINVPVNNVMNLAKAPYWERCKAELQEDIVARENIPSVDFQPILKNIKELQKKKDLSNTTVSQLKQFIGIDNIKKAELPQLEKLQSFLGDLKEGDKFLSDKQLIGLKDIIKELPNPEITPKRIIVDTFGEKDAIMEGLVVGKISPELMPTVDIKEGRPLIKKIVEGASDKFTQAENIINERNKKLDLMLNKAEKSRNKLLPLDEKLRRKLIPQNKEIFQALSGEKIDLTKEEVGVVSYLKNFFTKARKELTLEKYRKNYITHLEQTFTEKILNDGLFNAIKGVLGEQKKTDIPVNIMLELDNIIGSEKFFRFALERKGGIEPTTNIRRIINQYSSMLETKKVLDEILPEGQAVTRNLLQGKSAVWMKRYLQNLKGRGLDSNFKNGPMGWLARTADGIVDYGYLKLLGLNYKSALKNIVAGEANSWIYQDFQTYLTGKQRFWSNPKRAYQLATKYGALEGTYSDFAQKGIGKLKKLQDLAMVGQKAGEVEIRSSIFASMLTEQEWKTGKISPEKYNQIKDTIAITQGVFSKADSPLWVQTWYGRMFFQMNRWRITNAMLLRRLTNDAYVDVKAGKWNTQNTARFGKALVAYGVGMYISKELAKAGFKTASDVTANMAQTIDGIVSLFSKGELNRMFKDNPTLHIWGEFSNTAQNVAVYLHIPGAKKAKDKGIEDTYIAPIETIKEVVD